MSFRVKFFTLVFLLFILVGGDMLYLGIYQEINLLFEITLLLITVLVLSALVYVVEQDAFANFRFIKLFTKSIKEGDNIEISGKLISETESIVENLQDIAFDIKEATNFVRNIGQKNFDFSAKISNETALGSALLEMREQLRFISDEEQSRKWTVEGIAKFSDLLRDNQNTDTQEIAYLFISELVKYLEANQGAIYIINREAQEPIVEVAAAYAYAKRKFMKRTLQIQEGLVGRCILDEEIVYIDDIPANYIHITSGLGDALPRSILLAPIRINKITYGVVEIASFHSIPLYRRLFVGDIAEDFASTVANTQINAKTRELSSEAEKMRAELAKKEENLRLAEQKIAEMEEIIRKKEKEIAYIKNTLSIR